ncbi:MAG: BREX system ATP-binding protein BrxD [Myxococcales bacterium]|nr:BREX system ATP-binding protein BrxD [Myxococcales bacterium]
MGVSERDARHLFERLSSGLVPERGLDAIAVGIERERGEIARLLELAEAEEGLVKFLRGGYGCGKTFNARLAIQDAQARGFATSFVVVSDNDLHFHKFDDVYRKVVGELSTASCPRGALGDILDRWFAKVEDKVIAGGADPDAPDFDDKVAARMGDEIASATRGAAPEDFVRALRTIFALKQKGQLSDAGALISWLSGSSNVAAAAKRLADLKGDIGSRDALDYLHGVLEIVKAAGYKGLVIVIDEVETILRMRQDVRGKSLNGIRQICDAADRYHGLLWLFTGTPELFDTRRGVAGLQPLHERIQFLKVGTFATLKQPQLELRPFDASRLREVALKLRELFPAKDRAYFESRLTTDFIDQLVSKVTAGLGGDVGKVPRQFLREFVAVLNLTNDEPTFDPMTSHGFEPKDLNDAEERARDRRPPYDPEPGDDAGYQPANVEW